MKARDERIRETIDHETIRRWAESRQGYPATVKDSASRSETGVLRIGFEDENEPDLQRISWDEFFGKFEEKGLAMRYRNEPEEGGFERFHEFFQRH